jgi:hypothetical protein
MAMVRYGPEKSNPPVLDDGVLREMYIEYDTPCDALVSDPAKLLSFAQDYTERTGQHIEPAGVSHRLLSLRKLGEARGGLPRIRRSHHGRK